MVTVWPNIPEGCELKAVRWMQVLEHDQRRRMPRAHKWTLMLRCRQLRWMCATASEH